MTIHVRKTSGGASDFPEPLAFLAADPRGQRIVTVLQKRTYTFGRDGQCRVSEAQLPLDTRELSTGSEYDPSWKSELDVAPYKVATDLLVFGTAHAPGGRCEAMDVGVRIGRIARDVRVIGNRRCSYRPGALPVFSRPEPFETMPLGYDRAYGGVDPNVEFPSDPQSIEEMFGQLLQVPGAYPRNHVGKGYVVHADPGTIEGLELPNLEDPSDLLTPDRLVSGQPEMWHRQPIPRGFGWFDLAWYPRCAFAGGLPLFAPPESVREVSLGYIPAEQVERLRSSDLDERIDYRLFNGASPGLILPFLRGDEIIKVSGMNPSGECVVRLPGDRPSVAVRCRGQELIVEIVPHTVSLLMDDRMVYVVWRASARLPADFVETLPTKENPERDVLDDFEILVR